MTGTRLRRVVGLSLLVVLLAVFGTGTPANAQSLGEDPSRGAVVLAVATPPAPGLAQPPGAPDLPLADAEPAASRDDDTTHATDHVDTPPATPRAHRQPAADRAPPA